MSSIIIKGKEYKVDPEVAAELDEVNKDRKRLYDFTLDFDDARDTAVIMQALASLSRSGQEELAQAAVKALDRYETRNFVTKRDQK